ncbi:Lon protease homolog, mitochondrial [Taphrina deformans PYCC 5710]|uniref:Lon protease homolog, mitochondrial n=1 Tax=Taphrina deformans (strain PYCC 5710 / ATCC 11124 / CBS 356.35 / IMI 108563 / JCM 9778 / NBRC 8474) TaxID=1097556 RepID=R4X8A6_TAPDE|nr:Lon protease homolog, mitochondrial [Taphrina deformans PYCC 5710]|eukprot:CCG81502.1 Lon protease homolog, mitochondrial [Taphrina deformans PYCC 5710]
MVLVAAAQICSTSNILRNMEMCTTIIKKAASAGARCVFLPEASDFIASNADESIALTGKAECAQFVKGIQAAARDNNVDVNVCVHESPLEEDSRRISNSSLWIDAYGSITQRYRKLHLFDVDIKNGPILKESNSTEPGRELIAPFDTPCGKVGMAICFDLRFPEVSLNLVRRGAQVLLYPSAFAIKTGAAHWETLLRARAIENSAWVIAAAQAGNHNEKRASYGHALIVDPWGAIVAQSSDMRVQEPSFILADIDIPYTNQVRTGMPLLRRTDVYPEIIRPDGGQIRAFHGPFRPSVIVRKDADDSSNSKKSPEERAEEAAKKANSESASSEANAASADGSGKANDNMPKAVTKLQVPEVYPEVLALPIVRRPLFPGFYKAVVVKDPQVIDAIKEAVKVGQPYLGAFLLKDDKLDTDVITSLDMVYDVGVFAQITSIFGSKGADGKDESLTCVLYPHRRIKINSIAHNRGTINASTTSEGESMADPDAPIVQDAEKAAAEDDAAEKKSTIATKPEDSDLTSPVDAVPIDANPEEAAGQAVSREGSSAIQQGALHVTQFLKQYSVTVVNVSNPQDEPYNRNNENIKAITAEIVNTFKEIAQMNPLFRDQIANFSMSQSAGSMFEEPARLADFAAAVSAGETAELQEILKELNIENRIHMSLVILKKELMNAQLQQKISKDVEGRIQKRQREFMLLEQLKGIKRELGIDSDGRDKLVEKFKERAVKLSMPDHIRPVFDEELAKLQTLEPASSEFSVSRNYIDWLTSIPWGQKSTENYDIQHAIRVLDEDHYGLKDIKDRILEFIAVGKLRGTVEGKILCFVGPPGVGKTSIGKSIARALSRQFYRFSVGGLTDVAEIKGHRRTYVGAMPGKVIQSLKKVQTENPLILIDEIDKVGRGYNGDPSSALLELLDPEQNSSFLDHYLDLPVDLSKVLFVCTANQTDTIPGPLLDRMEVIQLSGYIADEKKAIAKQYLAPTAKESAGLQNANVNITDEAIEKLIKEYCREAGVRNLKKQIDKVFRKSSFNIVKELGEAGLPESSGITKEGKEAAESAETKERDQVREQETETPAQKLPNSEPAPGTSTTPRTQLEVPDSVKVSIDADSLKDYVGAPIYLSDRLYEKTPPGVVMGLAWTSMGGTALYIESILESALSRSTRPSFNRTGKLGDVMKESSTIAYSFAKGFMVQEFQDNRFFEKAQIHLHCPEGAVGKDGPSAGITMTTALLSLALDYPLDPTIAMTGELTLTGKVLRIGGLKEKAVAAKRSGVKTILFPDSNKADWEELPENIKEGLTGVPVAWYGEVFDVVFKDLDRQKANLRWSKDIEASDKREKEMK